MVKLTLLVSPGDFVKPSDCIFSKDFDLSFEQINLSDSAFYDEFNKYRSLLRQVRDLLLKLGLTAKICINVLDYE